MKMLLFLLLPIFLYCADIEARLSQASNLSNFHAQNGTASKEREKLEKSTKAYLVSVKSYPSELHLCDAFFVKPNVLVTTARCVYSRNPETLFVDLSSSMDETGRIYDVNNTIIHENFEMNPHVNDIALIKLKQKAYDVVIYKIPAEEVASNNKTYVFTWKFSPDQKKFTLTYIKVTRIPRSICADALRQYVGCDSVCPASNTKILMGSYDQGSPLGEVVGRNSFLAWGIYNRLGQEYKSKVELYMNLVPYRDWIAKHS